MDITLSLDPEIEKGLMARARARDLSLDEYLRELVARDAKSGLVEEQDLPRRDFDNLSDLLLHSPLAGANLDLDRSKDYPRPVDLS